ncbi:Zinc transporter ZIP11 [Armadillidium vulgare]|nr:Zinc transporter ZIP11 [Armadillidium vulgare]
MIKGINSSAQALLGTFMTWGLTAAGSAVVFFMPKAQPTVLDSSLGFAAGVMIAASYWSLLAPAIELANESGSYGSSGQYSFIPVAVGFLLGALFVYGADILVTKFGIGSLQESHVHGKNLDKEKDTFIINNKQNDANLSYGNRLTGVNESHIALDFSELKQRNIDRSTKIDTDKPPTLSHSSQRWKRIFLMIVAITGLAVGVGFGAVGKSTTATFNKAKWGQLSGMVEPIAGFFGAVAVQLCEPLLPYALSFAAGAMIFVVVDDIIPESHSRSNGRLASFWCVFGFIVMMVLDVALG